MTSEMEDEADDNKDDAASTFRSRYASCSRKECTEPLAFRSLSK